MDNGLIENKEEGQLVTFLLGRETYGIDIFKIQEVLHFQKITSIPSAPGFVEGVIEVRERVIPVVDLKKRLGVGKGEETKRRIVILDLDEQSLGVIVDDISKVLMLEAEDYEALPEAVVGDREKACISRLAKTDEGLVIIVSPERILSRGEIETLKDFQESREGEPVDAVSSHGAV